MQPTAGLVELWFLSRFFCLLCRTYCSLKIISKQLFNNKPSQRKRGCGARVSILWAKPKLDSGKVIVLNALVIKPVKSENK